MSFVSTHNEWDPLEEVVIGTMRGAQVPQVGDDLFAVEFSNYGHRSNVPTGPYSPEVVETTETELDDLARTLKQLGIKVRRPEPRDTSKMFSTTDWATDGFYDYCPRDVLLTIGNSIIETPMVLRSRYLEPNAYRSMLIELMENGSRWFSAPKPRLLDEFYKETNPPGERLLNEEPAFDAANVLKLGTDILYLVSDSGNEKGLEWLRLMLGEKYTIHPCRNMYASTHIDSTIVPIRPGLVLLNPERVTMENMPTFLRKWDHIWCPPLQDTGYVSKQPYSSTWIGMNLLVVSPGRVIIDDRQTELIALLEAKGVETIPQRLTHSRTLGGSFHCVSLDIRRSGRLETYQ
ncbi:hypothetical protein KTJ89_06745 [Brevibacterium sediminis]|uniref:hypothetical protein n=1 Tax=Brevibacterium sediminis TaxID=1857024 RepID=UPI002175188E|nr:hypothetical protein [Brevibacterium sediminis]MCS4592681.1 hypothetical protein [Brevibacterium sediminis]